MVVSLEQLKTSTAVIEKLDLTDDSANRLKSLGVFEGQTIELTRAGNPMIVKAAGSRVAIAEPLAKCIFVRDTSE